MLKVGITGADHSVAGDLIRLLLIHPEVELTSLLAPAHRGKRLSSVHYGLIGETEMTFSDNLNPENIDVLFKVDGQPLPSLPEDVKIIDFTSENSPSEEYVFGLSEINRKPLVRGATKAYLPKPLASAALIALGPLALNLLLSDYIDIDLIGPDSVMQPGELEASVVQIERVLRAMQSSFNGNVRIKSQEKGTSDRVARIKLTIPTAMSVENIIEIFEGIYDDHNFTFISDRAVTIHEVKGTNRVILYVSKPADGFITVEAVVDIRMRGGASEAVHIMNLLSGLHEKTGLNLPAR